MSTANGVAELVALRLIGRLAAAPGERQRMATEALAPQPAEDVGQGAHAELARGAWRQLETAALAVEVARLLERTGELVRAGRGRRSHRRRRGRAAHRDRPARARRGRARRSAPPPSRRTAAGGRSRPAHRPGPSAHRPRRDRARRYGRSGRAAWRLPARRAMSIRSRSSRSRSSISVAQLLAHLRAHAVEQRRHLRRLPMEVLDQLIGVRDAGREVAAVLRHEGVEVVGRIGARWRASRGAR